MHWHTKRGQFCLGSTQRRPILRLKRRRWVTLTLLRGAPFFPPFPELGTVWYLVANWKLASS